MDKARKMLLGTLAVFFALSFAGNAAAFDNPDEDDIFWDTLAAMDNPNDVDGCKAKIEELWSTGELNRYDVERRRAEGQDVPDSELYDMSEEHHISMTAGYYDTCENFDEGFEIMRASMEQYGKTSNIWDMADWHNVSGLYFASANEGRIDFGRTLDFMSYRFQIFMQNLPNLMTFQNGYISLNAEMVPELANYGATLTMYNLDFDQTPDIYVDGVLADASALGAVYDSDAGTLTFNAEHFSSYRAVAKGSSVNAMRIKWNNKRALKYNARKSSFKVKVKGTGFKNSSASTTCTLGFFDATKVSVSKNGKKATCTFNMSDFNSTGYYPLTISIDGVGEVTRENAVRVK
ncbi:MAG: hypothetical protein A3J76_01250 [Candidatus Moranbacteria bacterium RBG_13_45_13]|nr:MAG: hypothetical protein A3J76_01250 [Candidatus Moranbacteria bacterium RBG_13_45_13]